MESSSSEHNAEHGQRFQRTLTPAAARRRATLAEQAERNGETLHASNRARFWFAVRTALFCMLGCLAGLFPMAWALHTTDVESGKIAWRLGPVIGTSLVVVVLIIAGIKWDRDDW